MNDAFISPVEIAKRICVLDGDTAMAHMGRVMVAVGQATTDVYQNAIPVVKSEFFQIQDNLTIPFPNGAANILKVGAMNNHAQIVHLYKDDRLRRDVKNKMNARIENCDLDAATLEASYISKPVPREHLAGDWYHNCVHNVGTFGELYGYRFDMGSIGTWRPNVSEGLIEFGSGPFVQAGRWVIVEYKDMGAGRFSTIPSEAVPAIMTRARWWLSGGGHAGAAHHMDFRTEYAQYRRSVLRMDIMDYLRGIGSNKPYPYKVGVSDLVVPSSSSSSSSSGGSTPTIPAQSLKYFDDDDAALAAGLTPGKEYLLTQFNNYSLPGGLHKTIYNGP